MRVIVLLAASLSLLSACGPSPEQLEKQRQQKALAEAIEAVKAQLRDPESVQFGDVTYVRGAVCGYVNAKNGYGGYAGRVRFFAVGTSAHIEGGDLGPGGFHRTYDMACSNDPGGAAQRLTKHEP